jgi:effector-binding domain-containing protein
LSEPHTNTRNRKLARNSLRLPRENRAFSKYSAASLARTATIFGEDFSEHNKITGFMSLYKVEPKIYRAGVSLDVAAKDLPAPLAYTRFKGGKYSRFVLTGAYSQLREASGRVFQAVAAKKIPVRDDFCTENYLNDPRTTRSRS